MRRSSRLNFMANCQRWPDQTVPFLSLLSFMAYLWSSYEDKPKLYLPFKSRDSCRYLFSTLEEHQSMVGWFNGWLYVVLYLLIIYPDLVETKSRCSWSQLLSVFMAAVGGGRLDWEWMKPNLALFVLAKWQKWGATFGCHHLEPVNDVMWLAGGKLHIIALQPVNPKMSPSSLSHILSSYTLCSLTYMLLSISCT